MGPPRASLTFCAASASARPRRLGRTAARSRRLRTFASICAERRRLRAGPYGQPALPEGVGRARGRARQEGARCRRGLTSAAAGAGPGPCRPPARRSRQAPQSPRWRPQPSLARSGQSGAACRGAPAAPPANQNADERRAAARDKDPARAGPLRSFFLRAGAAGPPLPSPPLPPAPPPERPRAARDSGKAREGPGVERVGLDVCCSDRTSTKLGEK